ncbi:MAG: hypothetical protein ACKVS9_16490 [Phycisphaerae bacterium]
MPKSVVTIPILFILFILLVLFKSFFAAKNRRPFAEEIASDDASV